MKQATYNRRKKAVDAENALAKFSAPVRPRYPLNDVGNAQRLANLMRAEYGNIRYGLLNHEATARAWWYLSEHYGWKPAYTRVMQQASLVHLVVYDETTSEDDKTVYDAICKWAVVSGNLSRIKAMISLLEVDPEFNVDGYCQ